MLVWRPGAVGGSGRTSPSEQVVRGEARCIAALPSCDLTRPRRVKFVSARQCLKSRDQSRSHHLAMCDALPATYAAIGFNKGSPSQNRGERTTPKRIPARAKTIEQRETKTVDRRRSIKPPAERQIRPSVWVRDCRFADCVDFYSERAVKVFVRGVLFVVTLFIVRVRKGSGRRNQIAVNR